MEMGGISRAARMTASCSASLRDWALKDSLISLR
jgi:hypothetical protein